MNILDILTMDEIEELTLLTGKPFEELYAKGLPLGKPAKALIWVLSKRNDPDIDFASFGKWNLHQITEALKGFLPDPKATN